jgi:uncharacterized protein YecE (DUF72 family)
MPFCCFFKEPVKDSKKTFVPKVKEASQKVKKIVGDFNNHYHGYAIENCLYLIERLD